MCSDQMRGMRRERDALVEELVEQREKCLNLSERLEEIEQGQLEAVEEQDTDKLLEVYSGQ